MALLLLLTSTLLVLSGVIKIRWCVKAGMGVSWPALLELAVAAAALLLAGTGSAASRTVAWIVPAGVLLVILSSSAHVLKIDAYRRDREARLGARLDTYIKYLAGSGNSKDDG